jgi:hypothetical protein
MKAITRALVTVQINIHVGDDWGGECNLGQVCKQASEAAIQHVRRRFDKPQMPVTIVSIDAITQTVKY